MCKGINDTVVDARGYNMWKAKEATIQDALPTLSADERELLMTGTCKPCWDTMWSEDKKGE